MYYVNSVSVYPSSVSLSVGEWYYYAYAVVDDPCGCSGVSWSSGNSSVATVNSSSGYIYAKAPGTAKIYATATDGSGKRDYLTVTVTSGNVCVSSVSLSEISLTMQKDSCHQLYAYIAPSNATNKSVTWSSNNTAVATVDSNGRVTAVSAGYAVITVKANDGSDERAWCYVTVTGNVLATSVTMSETCITLKAGQSQDLNAQICPENVTATCIAWRSSDTNIVTVNPDSGMVYAKSQGTAYVYAITVDGSGVFGSCFVTVEPLIPIECVSICPDSMTMNVCESSRLTATVCPGDADDTRVVWRSSDEDVVCVDSDGNVYANCDGTATITAISVSDNSKYGTCTIKVKGEVAYYNIVNKQTNKVLNIKGSYMLEVPDYRDVTLYTASGSNEQLWRIDDVSSETNRYIRSYVDENYGINVDFRDGSYYSCNMLEIIGNEYDSAVNFIPAGDGYYYIKLANYDKYLTPVGTEDGSAIKWLDWQDNDLQVWYLIEVDIEQRAKEIEKMLDNIQNCPTSIIPNDKKYACLSVAEAMLNVGYRPAFVAGMLSNIVSEGAIGFFESSAYKNNSSKKPGYLVYMDSEYNGINFYLDNYSGKTIMDVNVMDVYDMLDTLNTNSAGTWEICGTRVGFGLGCIQWSFSRTFTLVKLYLEMNNNGSTITKEQAAKAEALMVLKELSSYQYSKIVTTWEKGCIDLHSISAANYAGRELCNEYLSPADKGQAQIRADRSELIYAEMIKQ